MSEDRNWPDEGAPQAYFGFDLGDGESAVAWLNSEGSAAPLMLEIAGRKSVLSALGRSKGVSLIGEQACLSDVDQLFVRFKSRFLTDPEGTGPLIRAFAEKVLEEVARSGHIADPRTSFFFVGCPSGWRANTREQYRRIFLEAGFPNVEVVSESRAAFLFVRESGELRMPDCALARPTLVIDAGSSTTDFTFIRELRAVEVFDFGENHLGGGLIDQALLQSCIARHPQRERIGQILEKCPQYAARCELEARKVKEMYFTRRMQPNEGLYTMPCESSVKIYYEKPPIRVDLSCDDAEMRRLLKAPLEELGGQSYLDTYRQALCSARQTLCDDPPQLILLTGGASRMDFMASVAREVFPEAELVTGAEPEFSIARGLCYALRIDRRTAIFERDVKALIDSQAVEEIVLASMTQLFSAIAPVVARELTDEIAPATFRRWKRGEVRTIDEMSASMRDALSRELSNGALKEALEPVTRKWLDDIRPQLEALTDPICARCHLPLTTLRLSSEAPVDAARLDINAGSMVNLNLVQTVVDVVVACVVAGLLGGSGIAILMAGPVGLVVSFVIGFVASRLGTTLARQHIGKFDMPVFMRALFSERSFRHSLENREGELTAGICDSLQKMMQQPDPAIDQMTAEVSGAIERQLDDMAQRARLLIH